MKENNNPIQIITIQTNNKANNIFNTFLSFYTHKKITQTEDKFEYTMVFPDDDKSTKVKISYIHNPSQDYPGITDVNCYILLLDLEQEEIPSKLNDIIKYMNDYCDENKKIYILGLTSNKKAKPFLSQKEITNIMDDLSMKYEYHPMYEDDKKEIADYILQILMYCKYNNVHCDNEEVIYAKDEGVSHSCIII